MAEPVQIDFNAGGDLGQSLQSVHDLLVKVKNASEQAQASIQAEAKKSADATAKIEENLNKVLAVTAELNNEGMSDFAKDAKKAEGAMDSFDGSADDAKKGVQDLGKALEGTADDFREVGKASNEASKAANNVKKVTTEAKSASGVLGGLRTRFQGAFASVKDFVGNAGKGISDVGRNLKTSIMERVQGVAQGFAGLGGTAIAALGPIAVGAAAIGAGLLKVGMNIDSVATMFDGFRRTGGIVFDQITGKVKELWSGITSGESTIGKVFGFLGSSLKLVLSPLTSVVSKIGELTGITAALEEAGREGQALAEMYDAIDEAQTQNIKRNAELDRQITKLGIQLKDRTKSEKERLAIGEEIGRLEDERSANELKVLRDITAAKRREADNELKNKKEVSDETARALAEAEAAEINASTQSIALVERTQNRVNAIREAGAAEAKRIRDERIANEKKAAELELELSRKVAQAEIEAADPMDRLNREKQAAEEEVKVLQKKIEESNTLLRGNADLTVEQEQQLETLRLSIWDRYWADRLALEQENQKTLAELNPDLAARERAQLEVDLAQRAEVLRKAGATQEQIIADQANKRAELEASISQRQIDLIERTGVAEVEAWQSNGQAQEDFEKAQSEAILKIRIQAAKDRLALLKADGTAETNAVIAEAKATIAKLEGELGAMAAKKKPFDLFSLVGLNVTEEQKAELQKSVDSILGAVAIAQDAALAEVQASINATDAIIADRERRGEELRSQLDQEIALAEMGYANNIDMVRQQIAANDAAQQAEIARKQQLIQEEQRIAKQQIAIDTAVQVSQLALAAAKLFSSEAGKGIIGVIGAIGMLASLYATFTSFRAKTKALAAEQFGDGGWINGRSHAQGGKMIEAEGGEYVTRKKAAGKWGEVLEGINDNKWTPSRQDALRELMDSAGIQLQRDAVDDFVLQKEQHIQHSYMLKADNARLEREVRSMRGEVAGLRDDNRNQVHTSESGRVKTVSKGGFTRKTKR